MYIYNLKNNNKNDSKNKCKRNWSCVQRGNAGEVAKAPGLEFGLSSPGLFLSLSRTERGAPPWL